MTAYPGQTQTTLGQLCTAPMGLSITAECDTAWIRTMDCCDTSCTEMQCLRQLHHSGAHISPCAAEYEMYHVF
jgi:hypothetical protein